MAIFPARALWPDRNRVPLLRFGVALVVAPGILALLLAVAVFLVMGMTQTTGEGVLRETLRAAGALAALVFGYTFTFGLAGIAALWAGGRRGLVAWALAGTLTGALAGALFGALAMSGMRPGLVLAFALSGWTIFLLIRRFAGVSRLASPS